jgi:hypothetical protein
MVIASCVTRVIATVTTLYFTKQTFAFFCRKMPIKEYHYDKILQELELTKEEVCI